MATVVPVGPWVGASTRLARTMNAVRVIGPARSPLNQQKLLTTCRPAAASGGTVNEVEKLPFCPFPKASGLVCWSQNSATEVVPYLLVIQAMCPAPSTRTELAGGPATGLTARVGVSSTLAAASGKRSSSARPMSAQRAARRAVVMVRALAPRRSRARPLPAWACGPCGWPHAGSRCASSVPARSLSGSRGRGRRPSRPCRQR